MFLPIGDSPNLPRTPWVTWGLIALNVALFALLWPLSFQRADFEDGATRQYLMVLQEERQIPVETLLAHTSRGDVVRFEWGSKPAQLSLLTMLTSMFLHGGLMHLVGNMLFLWIFGDNIEHRLGRLPFLMAYLGTGLAAALGDTLLRLGSSVPSVGASGAISGVLGLYFLWFPRNRVRVFVFLFPFLMDVIELPARWVLGAYLVLDNLLPLLVSGGSGGVSYGAHIGGFVAGVGLAWTLRPAAWGEGVRRPVKTTPGGVAGPLGGTSAPASADAATTFGMLLDEDRVDEAGRLFFDLPRELTRRTIPAVEKLRLAQSLAAGGQPRPALAALQRVLSEHPRGPGRVEAHLGAAQLLLHAFDSPTAAYQHLYSALEESPSAEQSQVARQLQAELEARTRGLPKRPRW